MTPREEIDRLSLLWEYIAADFNRAKDYGCGCSDCEEQVADLASALTTIRVSRSEAARRLHPGDDDDCAIYAARQQVICDSAERAYFLAFCPRGLH